MNRIWVNILFLFSATHVYGESDIYQCTDKSGRVVISNVACKNAKKMQLPALPTYAVPMSISDVRANGYVAKPALINDFKYQDGMNKNYPAPFMNNDIGRQQILSEELLKEQEMLQDSEQLLTQGKSIKYTHEMRNDQAFQERIQILEDSVHEHEKNIELLNLQLRN